MTSTSRIAWQRQTDDESALLSREWLVTNGLGGYASGTLIGAPTRRYHGLLIAALPPPLGRSVMLDQVTERLSFPDGSSVDLSGYETGEQLDLHAAKYLREFRLDQGLPVWIFDFGAYAVERRLVFAHLQNTVFLSYRLLQGSGSIQLQLRPALSFRPHEDAVSPRLVEGYAFSASEERYEIVAPSSFPPLRFRLIGEDRAFTLRPSHASQINYRVESARGYPGVGALWSPGHFHVTLTREQPACLVASTEPWADLSALQPDEALAYELERRTRLSAIAKLPADDAIARELVLAADQFVIAPRGRTIAAMRAHARGDELRSVIAGYHWFTDWGRDTMISFEGLLLQTGRFQEARYVLHMFAQYARNGLIPNLFPERIEGGLYHTADATLWFFHAVDRYLAYTRDRQSLRELLPVLQEIVAWHVRGTDFGIRVDARDGLLAQGEPGYQLTWMDAKCDGWVVTPRRGKAVEINALWHNALANLARWMHEESQPAAAAELEAQRARCEASFNARFFCHETGHLYDVVDGEDGKDDPALRPNQVFAISLPNPVLRHEYWQSVMSAISEALLTPVGLRSLARAHPDYKPSYHGDLRTRDAAYHQGTVWSWLIGPYVDAWLKVNPDDIAHARSCLTGLVEHLGEAGIGTVSEVFDAEQPFTPRGCVAQAWGVAELLRAWRLTSSRQDAS
jgi:predicted glycogen debranching enzyme